MHRSFRVQKAAALRQNEGSKDATNRALGLTTRNKKLLAKGIADLSLASRACWSVPSFRCGDHDSSFPFVPESFP